MKGIKYYTKAIKANPKDATAYYQRGHAYGAIGNDKKALADFISAIKIDPEYAEAYRGRGRAYLKKEDYDRALADFTRSIKIDPNHVEAYYNRGHVYEVCSAYDRAIADFTRVIKINPDFKHGHAYYMRGYVRFLRGDHRKDERGVLKDLEKARDLGIGCAKGLMQMIRDHEDKIHFTEIPHI